MHLAVYKTRPDVNAIVHTYPVTATFFTLTDCPINLRLTGEAHTAFGRVVRIPYALMGTPELAAAVAEYLRNCDCGLMDNHGVIMLGKSLLFAFDKMKLLVCAAKQMLMSSSLPGRELTSGRLDELDRFAGRE